MARTRSRNSYQVLSIEILQKNGRPMHVKEILEHILESKVPSGKTPGATLSSVLQRSSYFVRTSKGTFDLTTDGKNYKL